MPELTPEQTAAAEQERLDDEREELIYAIEGPFARDDYDEIRAAIAPHLAAIRRHAAAQALREQANILGKRRAYYIEGALSFRWAGTPTADTYRNFAQQAGADARALRAAADEIIAEGWEFTCAQTTPATREDPAEGCEEPVETEGDYCPRHTDDRDPDE